MQMRTIDQAAAHFKDRDPHTALSKTALRRLVTTGAIPSVRVGLKYLVSLEAIDDFLQGATSTCCTVAEYGNIRPIGL